MGVLTGLGAVGSRWARRGSDGRSRAHRALLFAAPWVLLLGPARALAEDEGTVSPEIGGILVVPTSSAAADDPRLGRIAARFAAKGLEAVVAADCLRPPPDPERALLHARWRLDDARRARRLARHAAAAAAADEAMRAIEVHAFERGHLDLLVEAQLERGATALDMGDPATAETVFLKALAIDPFRELDPELYGAEVVRLFGDVRQAARELRFGSLRVEVTNLPGALVSIDFGAPQEPPVELKLPDGRHFVSVSAPSRHEVVAFVPVRAERATVAHIRPPISGDVRERAAVLASFRAGDPRSITDLSRALGLRFVVTADIGETGIGLAIFDGGTGQRLAGGEATLSLDPVGDEIDAAREHLLAAAVLVEPRLDPTRAEGGWYTSWWALGLLGLAAAGAATTTVLLLGGSDTTEYRFQVP